MVILVIFVLLFQLVEIKIMHAYSEFFTLREVAGEETAEEVPLEDFLGDRVLAGEETTLGVDSFL